MVLSGLGKSLSGAMNRLMKRGPVDKEFILELARSLSKMKFKLVATGGTAKRLQASGIKVESLKKISEGSPNALDLIQKNQIHLVINTASGVKPRKDEIKIRSMAVSRGIPCVTTVEGAVASVQGIQAMHGKELSVCSLQKYHEKIHAAKVQSI